ncbi:cupin [Massilia violaceinigra]|uniref:Cupin n=1 Tax=Massilia violaceinigra TaxID=2045208 RepID=A0A2D2DE85_9BURK|nr:cupin domain-containing protein [Massilia violaceinigra]ATQ73301.1 cupin [Massilia violaceinigra]
MPHPIINLDQLALQDLPPQYAATGPAAERFAPRMAMIGELIGMRALGCNLTVLAPGKRAFPFHNHRVNEEVFIVVEGCGTIRIGAASYPLRQGDIVACPAGGQETAHQIINTGEVELRYLALSTNKSPEVVEFPDSGKYATLLLDAGGGANTLPQRTVGHIGQSVDYWEGE